MSTTTTATTGMPNAATPRRGFATSDAWLKTNALSMVLVLAALTCAAVAGVLLVGFDGWAYYTAPLAARGYMPQHAWLRPSGTIGLALGIAGVTCMVCTLPYALRKRWKALASAGPLRGWLEVHIFFGIVGPVLVTFHTSFKFNGLISVAYWLMAIVWSSGFIGRYLYVRIPKTIRGTELSRADVEARLDMLGRSIAGLPPAAMAEIAAFERAVTPGQGHLPGVLDLFLGEVRVRLRLAMMRRHLLAAGVDVGALQQMVALATERATMVRRLAHLERARRIFQLWHLFHQPLVFGLFVIVALHIAVAVFFGYSRLAN